MAATRFRPALLTAATLALSLTWLAAAPAGDWQRDETSLAWRSEGRVVWKYSFDPRNGKPFFDPLGPAGGPRLTNFKPEDHPWHYGLWFSWKYINGANYWEENRTTGRAEGLTSWKPPTIETGPDGRATIAMDLTYTHPTGRVDLSETRQIAVSAPEPSGTYTIDWRSRFVAGREGAVLGRTPMPGEPNGAFNGGYAGLGARLASAPLVMTFVSTEGPITEFTRNRARPSAAAVAANVAEDGTHAGSIALVSDPANIGERAPWYLINEPAMRFMDPAVLAPAVRTLTPGEAWVLNYRIILSKTEWTPESLRAAVAAWRR
jgi:hypothetical protein